MLNRIALLKGSKQLTKNEKDGDGDPIEVNYTEVHLLIPTEEMSDAEIAYLARNQNHNVLVELAPTWKATRDAESVQITMDKGLAAG
jgi:hypothetical protein